MQYFKHFGTMRHDIKIKRVISKYGLEGYGLYNLTLESITESLSTQSPMPDLQETCEDLAEFYNGNTAKINEIMNFMVNQGLFDLDEFTGRIVCTKLYKFLEASQTRSEEIRKMIKSYRKTTNQAQIENMSETVSDGNVQHDAVSAKSERREEEENKKKNQNKKREAKHKHGEYNHVLLTESQYSKLLEEWGASELSRMITKLDEGIQMKGYKYKDHNLTLRKWKRDEKPAKQDNHRKGGINFEI